jgi:hypothetical protein
MLLYFEDLVPHWLGVTLALPEDRLEAVLTGEIDGLTAELERRGLCTFVSTRTVESLRTAARTDHWMLAHDPEVLLEGRGRAARTVLTHLETRYRMVPVKAHGFDGYRLERQ